MCKICDNLDINELENNTTVAESFHLRWLFCEEHSFHKTSTVLRFFYTKVVYLNHNTHGENGA